MHDSGLLAIGEAARIVGVNVWTIRRWADEGRIPVVILPSGHRRFHREDIETILERKAS